jgi:hypothetical protein
MQINSINQSTNPNFGMAIRMTPEAFDRVAVKLKSIRDKVELDKLLTRESFNDVADTFVSVENPNNLKSKVIVKVGTQTYKEGLLGGPLAPIRKGANYAKDIMERSNATKLEADVTYLDTLRNKSVSLASQKEPIARHPMDGEEIVEITGASDSPVSAFTIDD